MTKKQFDSYRSLLLISLKQAQKEIAEQNAKSETLDKMIEDYKSELKKPLG